MNNYVCAYVYVPANQSLVLSSFQGDYLQNHEFVVLLANEYALCVLLGL